MDTEDLKITSLSQKFELLVSRFADIEKKSRKFETVNYKSGLNILSKIARFEYKELTDTLEGKSFTKDSLLGKRGNILSSSCIDVQKELNLKQLK